MRCIFRKYCTEVNQEFYAHSTIKIFRNDVTTIVTEPKKNILSSTQIQPKIQKENDVIINKSVVDIPASTSASTPTSASIVKSEYRENELQIQMLSKNLYQQIFGNVKCNPLNETIIEKCLQDMKKHHIEIGQSPKLNDVQLKLPTLKGKSIEEHFYNIAQNQCEPFKNLIQTIQNNQIPSKPSKWNYKSGWTCYDENGGSHSIEFPDENILIFDVETCMSAGYAPTLACAVGKKYWYSWTSSNLINSTQTHTTNNNDNRKYELNEMISLGKNKPKLIIGHNVSYDRARIQEQYLIEDTGTRFLDTMSLHVCVSGVTSYQRAMLKSNKEFDDDDLLWSSQSSLNSLAEVYKLYCKKELKKEARNIFVKGQLEDVQENFQDLMNYCAQDVIATQQVFQILYPIFEERFPHPATLAGMLEIGSAYLPVNSNWNRYIEESNLTYEDLDIEAKYQLSKRADEACQLLNDDKYKENLWMWDEDWSIQNFKLKKPIKKTKKQIKAEEEQAQIHKNNLSTNVIDSESETVENNHKFQYLYDMKNILPARRYLLPGYPAWYRKLCSKPDSENWIPGANNIGTGMQIAPKLLSLCWEGYPLHYIREQGWGFLIPFQQSSSEEENQKGKLPIAELIKKCPVIDTEIEANEYESLYAMNTLWKDVESTLSKKDFYKKKPKKDRTTGKYTGTGIWCNEIVDDCCWFLKLPHKNGPSNRVGNPLARDFLNKFSENVLSGDGDKSAERVIEIARMLSYWRNNRDRIMNQLVIWLNNDNLPRHLRNSEIEFGAIVPQVVVCGTLTRRAMEPTWMTASNAQKERVGSELRSMVQAPSGYKIVGADVDSQELWIASVLGDAHATGMHGATPLGWMTLSGNKTNETDMHSVTAKAVGISRDHAKVINYARIYGAGRNFAERLLKQFNPTISDAEAKAKSMKMFSLTKGKKKYYLKPEYEKDYVNNGCSSYEALRIANMHGKSIQDIFERGRWEGGTESAMFNRLEEIAENKYPVTPFLECRLSRALEPNTNGADDRFLPTRVNWVVQSGAVDFLHLMLVSMRWLMGTHIKFCLSFHDEVRYLVKENLAYKTALAMHVTNLLTRSFCASKIGLKDLPQSVAFFSSVEIDTILRKEANADCKTPSNPHGLDAGYNIPKGESLDIYTAIEKAGNNDMSDWEWHIKKTRKINKN